MSRYFTKPERQPRAGYDPNDWNPLVPSLEVDDHVSVDTGLVDKRGDPIMRAPNPLGFCRDEEWS